MEKKTNYIIREVPPEQTDFSFYFDDDGLKKEGGDFCYTLFILGGRNCGNFNEKEYKKVQDQAESIIDGFADIENGNKYYYSSCQEVMQFNSIDFNSRKCHLLKEWAKKADVEEPESIAEFLTITTGKKWTTDNARGYGQGDYVEMVYCPEHYKDGVKHYGEIWLGAGKEFYTIDLDENGEQIDTCGGYIIADSQAWEDEDYKRLVCKWAGIPKDETRLEMIDGYRSYTKYNYRTA